MNSFLAYVGGKSQLAPKVIPLIAKHTCYVEVFAGAAWMLFKKPVSEVEIINDINSELVTLYRIVRCHYEEFARYFELIISSRDEYDRMKDTDPSTLTDIQRAVRFYYLIKNSFGSKIESISYNVATTKNPRITRKTIDESLLEAHKRIEKVYIENKPYQYIIDRYDKPHTFMCIDPPYYKCETYYGKGIFSREDFITLRDMLSKCKSKFIMSINDVPEIREMYKQFRIVDVPTTYTLGGADKSIRVGELLIMNYDPGSVELAFPEY